MKENIILILNIYYMLHYFFLLVSFKFLSIILVLFGYVNIIGDKNPIFLFFKLKSYFALILLD